MKNTLPILALILSIIVISCRKDFNTVPSYGKLQFSKDTVFLDTVFSNIGSATYNLKVYNKSSKTITIPEIKLENGNTSNYRLNVDGLAGDSFNNIDILANDSIYIFIETTINVNTITDPLYTDKILFDNGENQQDVDLVTLVQDAHFIFPSKNSSGIETLTINGKETEIQGRFLTDEELTFTNEKPYVIYGYAAVPSSKTLTVEAGAKIHFHNNSGLIIDKDANFKVNGTLDEKVIFEGDRLEHQFSEIPGQWGAIWIREGSFNNELNYTQIKNGTVGLLVDGQDTSSPTLTIKNTEIYNSSNYGVLGRNTHIEGENLVIGSAGQSALACTFGGKYNFAHATFANFWNNSIRQLPSVLVNNHISYLNNDNQEITETNDLVTANFINCIIEGNNNVEFILDRIDGTTFNYSVENCLIKFNDLNNSFTDNTELNFNDTEHYQNNILNGEPNFKDVTKNEFIIGENSDAINKAKPSTVSNDILGVDRSTSPDIGAYQHTNF
ncbi:hypothetical protein ABMY20_11255 [Tenacibaculum sp. SSH1-16]|uniref:hypothetical protein n=1 Tax=unclassified Tenacibaculum TaxID=2635139 RepID=UPI002096CAF8|nr:hypothetical protein [Tenacibaculum sp. XPcli2-G]MCO7186346.1 hypothetical protein [Tenacibaculum sp. XPcli2-G]BFF38105.1 hypothetical protein BACT7_29670 [Tenacibaculum mesophilum]